jgi:LacI family gluconate utilization system Gnt-I transcriptional repressor
VPRRAIGERSAQMILDRIEGRAIASPVVDLGYEIAVRESA